MRKPTTVISFLSVLLSLVAGSTALARDNGSGNAIPYPLTDQAACLPTAADTGRNRASRSPKLAVEESLWDKFDIFLYPKHTNRQRRYLYSVEGFNSSGQVNAESMMNPGDSIGDDDTLQGLIADFLDAENRGEQVDRAALLERHPEYADALVQFFSDHDRMASAANVEPVSPDLVTLPLNPTAGDQPTMPLASATSDSGQQFKTSPGAVHQKQASVGDRVRYFGDYELLSELARGGMGVVYKARQINLNRLVAVKMILAGQLASEEDVSRFYMEAEAAANLDHPGIVPIYEIGQHEGQHFFAMGFIEGQSLQQRIQDGPLPPREAAELLHRITQAIAYAHSQGVIHRDLKPANVLLDKQDNPKVTDFGLAKNLESESGLTRTGSVMGTPSYMPPEQAGGDNEQVGPRSDVYSLGALLYCLVVGRPPFQAANPLDTLLQVMSVEPVSPRQLNPQIPKDLETICLKCLQKEPTRRYESAETLAADLGRFLRAEPIHARAISPSERTWRWCKRNPVVAALLATATILLVISLLALKVATQQSALAAGEAKRAKEQQHIAEEQRDKTEATLARSNYYLAVARWDANRTRDASDLLALVPPQNRHFEWFHFQRQFQGGYATCYGHKNASINIVGFSPDGTQVVSQSEDNTIKHWDAATGNELQTLQIPRPDGRSYTRFDRHSFSLDNAKCISVCADRTLLLWDLKSGERIRDFEAREQSPTAIFSSDGKEIFIGNPNGDFQILDAATGQEIYFQNGNSINFPPLACSPCGTWIVANGTRGDLQIWDVVNRQEVRLLQGHSEYVPSVAFHPDGSQFVSVSADGTLKLWDVTTGEVLRTFEGHVGAVLAVAFSPDGMWIVSGSEDTTLRLWDAATGEAKRTFKGHTGLVRSVAFSPDGKRIVSGSDDCTIKLWDITEQIGSRRFEAQFHNIISLAFGKDSNVVALGTSDGMLKFFNLLTGEVQRVFQTDSEPVLAVAYSTDGQQIATGSSDGTLRIWDVATGVEIHVIAAHSAGVNSIAFGPDGRSIASASNDDTIRLWDTRAGHELLTLSGHRDWVNSIAFSPDGKRIISASGQANYGEEGDSTIRIWDVASGVELQILESFGGVVNCVAFSPSGHHFVSGSEKLITLWDSETGNELQKFQGHFGCDDLAFCADGSRIVSTSSNGILKLWDAKSGEELAALDGGAEQTLFRVAISPDNSRIVTLGRNAAKWVLTVWDTNQTEECRSLKGHSDYYVSNVVLSPDGSKVYSKSHMGKKIGWDVVSGRRLEFQTFEILDSSNERSVDGRWLAFPRGNDVLLVDLEFKNQPFEKQFRKSKLEVDATWHREQAELAVSTDNWYAATFHWYWVLNAEASAENAKNFKDAYMKLSAAFKPTNRDLSSLHPTWLTALELAGGLLDGSVEHPRKLLIEQEK
ncbi:protein kinase domain-containing protein [Planctomycetaceae bacterium SH139]